jgi:hypothetical protein
MRRPLAKAEPVGASRIRYLVGKDLRYHQGVPDPFSYERLCHTANDLAGAVILAMEELNRPAKELFQKTRGERS